MLKLGLFGKNISHSRSQEMYESLLKTKVEYHLLDYKDSGDIKPIEEYFSDGFNGLSITFPYKQHFLNQVEIQSPEIRDLQAINCIGEFNGKFLATNTDYLAAEHLLKNFEAKKFVILGNGNMARIFLKLMRTLGHEFDHFSRSKDGNLNDQDYHSLKKNRELVLINCCSRDYTFEADLPSGSTFWDMNYSFPEHNHLIKNEDIRYIEGIDLLLEQARFALAFWKIKPL